METNLILESSDRNLFGTIVRQTTKDQFLSVSDLSRAYEKVRLDQGWSDRSIDKITKTDSFKERVYHILKEKNLIKLPFEGFMKVVEEEGIVKTLKTLGVWKTTGKGATKNTMCNPYIWVLLALEMNPCIYAKVLVWLTDTLIFSRIEAGDEYKPMNAAIKSLLGNPDYALFARTINERVFGRHISGVRNIASSEQLRRIADIEKYITNLIEQKFVKTEEDIVKAIRTYR